MPERAIPHVRPFSSAGVLAVMVLFVATRAFGATVTSLADDGPGTLREAIAAASPGDTIDFSVSGVITLNTGLVIDKDLTLTGPGAASLALDGGGSVSILQVDAGATVAISGLTFQHGTTALFGGAIYNSGSLTLTRVVVSHNTADVNAGGIFNDRGTLTLDHAVVSDNVAGSNAGGIFNNAGGSLTLNDTVIARNTAPSSGGGIAMSTGTLVANNSTITENSSSYGGGIYGVRGNQSSITLNNSTLAGNSATAAAGAIYSRLAAVILNHATITGNRAGLEAGGLGVYAGALSARNSIVAGNLRAGDPSDFVDNCALAPGLAVASHGHNLVEDGTCNLTDLTDIAVSSSDVGLDPLGLRDNGGPTPTVALLAGTIGVDAVPVADCTAIDGTPVTTDQRGVTRPQGPGCDVGAFELDALTVEGALGSLVDLVDTIDVSGGTVNSLLAKLNSALASLSDDNTRNDGAAVNALQAFINAVEAQRGKKISDADADALVPAAQQIIALILG
jgi:hypothetical protein